MQCSIAQPWPAWTPYSPPTPSFPSISTPAASLHIRAYRAALSDVTITAKGICGKRHHMEDRHKIIRNIIPGVHYIGMFDGHGGADVAAACADIIGDRVRHHLLNGSGYAGALSAAIEEADTKGCAEWGARDTDNVGSTALVALVTDAFICVANVGDTEAYLLRGATAVPLSRPHRPSELDERLRIERAGGFIARAPADRTARVQGVLAITRALGDHALRPYVIARPEITTIRRSKRDRALVVATDGLWDVLAPEDVLRIHADSCESSSHGSHGSHGSHDGTDLASILVYAALERRSADNVSVAVATFSSLND